MNQGNQYSNLSDSEIWDLKKLGMGPEYIGLNCNNCLFAACFSNNINVIKCLVEECKMDLNALNESSHTCLMVACMTNHPDNNVIKYLIKEKQMDPMVTNNLGYTCLFFACMFNQNVEIIKYLIEEIGIKYDQLDIDQNNILALACQCNLNLDVIKYLVSLGLDPRHVNG